MHNTYNHSTPITRQGKKTILNFQHQKSNFRIQPLILFTNIFRSSFHLILPANFSDLVSIANNTKHGLNQHNRIYYAYISSNAHNSFLLRQINSRLMPSFSSPLKGGPPKFHPYVQTMPP